MQLDTWLIQGGGFHFGLHGLGQEETAPCFPSDSLFAALLARLAHLAGAQAVEEFTGLFQQDSPPFVLSSTFPFAGQVLFYPTPASARRGEAAGVTAKQLKKASYLSGSLFRALLDGQPLVERYPGALKLQGGSLLASPEEAALLPKSLQDDPSALIWQVEQRPRVTLGRAAQNSNIFFTGRVSYAADCGLWFAVRWLREDAALKARLVELLGELAEFGLGAERSIGFGACTIRPAASIQLPEPGGGAWLTLSRYLPRPDEMAALQHPDACYTLRSVGGWLDSPVRSGQRRRPVNLLAEGSIFGPLSRPIPGRVVDVRPSYESNPDPLKHPVYRSGLALAVRCQPPVFSPGG